MRAFGQLATRLVKFLVIFAAWLYVMRPAVTAAAVGQRQVEEAVARDLQVDLHADQLRLLADSRSLPEKAAMRVISARPGFTPGAWLLRLDCAVRRDCLPVHALLQLSAADDRRLREQGDLARRAVKRPPGAQAVTRLGEEVVLLEQLSGMRLRMKAVCLEPGALGDQIRVRNRATRRVLLATVAGPGLVQVMR